MDVSHRRARSASPSDAAPLTSREPSPPTPLLPAPACHQRRRGARCAPRAAVPVTLASCWMSSQRPPPPSTHLRGFVTRPRRAEERPEGSAPMEPRNTQRCDSLHTDQTRPPAPTHCAPPRVPLRPLCARPCADAKSWGAGACGRCKLGYAASQTRLRRRGWRQGWGTSSHGGFGERGAVGWRKAPGFGRSGLSRGMTVARAGRVSPVKATPAPQIGVLGEGERVSPRVRVCADGQRSWIDCRCRLGGGVGVRGGIRTDWVFPLRDSLRDSTSWTRGGGRAPNMAVQRAL
jgi:hypothetical protein